MHFRKLIVASVATISVIVATMCLLPQSWKSVTISDVNMPQAITVELPSAGDITSGIQLRAVGQLDGHAVLTVNGEVAIQVRDLLIQDQYRDIFAADSLVIEYNPVSVHGGSLAISYLIVW